MSDLAIRVENLSKRYTIGVERHDRLRDALSDFRLGILDFGKRNRKSKIQNRKSFGPCATCPSRLALKLYEVSGTVLSLIHI